MPGAIEDYIHEDDPDWRPDKLAPHFGTGVVDGQFWPRRDIEDRIIDLLTETGHVAMFGLRRIGKTSIFLRVKKRLEPRTNVVVAAFDAQGFKRPEDMLGAVLGALPHDGAVTTALRAAATDKAVPSGVRRALSTVFNKLVDDESVQTSLRYDYWATISQIIVDAASKSDEKLIVMIDEFPMMCSQMLNADERARDFVEQMLAQFRDWRQAGIAFLLTGSIGMQLICRRHGLPQVHLNDFTPVDVPPLERADAERLLAALVHHKPPRDWDDEVGSRFLDACGALYPALIQSAFLEIKLSRARSDPQIEALFAETIRPNFNGRFFEQFDTRLREYRDVGLEHLAKTILKEFGGNRLALSQSDIFDLADPEVAERGDVEELMRFLREDGFLIPSYPRGSEPQWRLGSDFVRQWLGQVGWRRR